MPYRACSRRLAGAVFSVLLLLTCTPLHAQAPLRTRNVVLIVSDGLRWQEVFTGADASLLNEANGGSWEKEADLRREFWHTDPAERRRALLPFLWNTVAAGGQMMGQQSGAVAGGATGANPCTTSREGSGHLFVQGAPVVN